jgi:phosphatidylglycerophosphate synthase
VTGLHGWIGWIPNVVSLLRLALGVVFPWIPPQWRLTVFGIAMLTDGLDGQASRWLGADSALGRILDPVADKVFFGMAAATLLVEGSVGWVELALAGVRDLAVLAGAIVALARDGPGSLEAMKPRPLGKLATVGQFAFFVVVIMDAAAWRPWLLGATALVGALSGWDYVRAYRRAPADSASTLRSPNC